MKLHIDVEQLNELSDKAKEKLWEYSYKMVTNWLPFQMTAWHSDQLPKGETVTFIGIDDHETGDFIRDISEPLGARYQERVGFQYECKCWLPLLSIGQMIELIDENDVGEWGIHNQAGD